MKNISLILVIFLAFNSFTFSQEKKIINSTIKKEEKVKINGPANVLIKEFICKETGYSISLSKKPNGVQIISVTGLPSTYYAKASQVQSLEGYTGLPNINYPVYVSGPLKLTFVDFSPNLNFSSANGYCDKDGQYIINEAVYLVEYSYNPNYLNWSGTWETTGNYDNFDRIGLVKAFNQYTRNNVPIYCLNDGCSPVSDGKNPSKPNDPGIFTDAANIEHELFTFDSLSNSGISDRIGGKGVFGNLESGWKAYSKNFQTNKKIDNLTWKWEGQQPKSTNYELVISQKTASGIRQILSTNVSGSSFDANKALEPYISKTSTSTFFWSVKDLVSGQKTPSQSFILSPCQIDFRIEDVKIECLGIKGAEKHYKICFKSIYTSSSGVLSFGNSGSGIIIINNGSNLAFSNLTPLLSSQTSGTSKNYCFEVLVPFNSNAISLGIQGDNLNQGGNIACIPGIELLLDRLPSCICDICKTKNITSTSSTITKSLFPAYNVRIEDNFAMTNSALIQQVKAEVVYLQNLTDKEECKSCTTSPTKMGMFAKATGSGKATPSNLWANAGNATLSDANNDNYGNEFTWTLPIGSSGVDFSTPKKFSTGINLPDISALSCCVTKYNICIRYTFTDVDCKTCDILRCYTLEVNKPTVGGGTVPTDPGVPTGQLPSKKNLKQLNRN